MAVPVCPSCNVKHTQAQTDNMKTATIRKRTHLCLKPALLLTEVFLFFGLTTADALELPDAALPLVSQGLVRWLESGGEALPRPRPTRQVEGLPDAEEAKA